jgi:tRNA-splicing ligase RtcB
MSASLRMEHGAGVAPAGRKLTEMSLGERMDPAIHATLERLAELPYVREVIALPDVHWKEHMEVPSSIAIETRDTLVPEFTSVAVNDGMGVIRTGLEAKDLTPERMAAFFTRINSHSASNFFETNRYSISPAELRRVVFDGLWTRFSRSEMGLNFGGNHFLELQTVDEVLDPAAAERWKLRPGQVVVMYHLGPGPFGGTLLNHYAARDKLQASRRPLFLVSKLLFHYVQRMGRGDWSSKWPTYFRRNVWTPLPAGSPEGQLLHQAFAMAINFGYGYRLATVAAIRDALRETIAPDAGFDPLCDISHNGVTAQTDAGGISWVARHNACRLSPGGPAIVAGSHDVASYLGVCGEGLEGRFHSYDHGGGHLIDAYRDSGRLPEAEGHVLRLKMTRGKQARIVRRQEMPMRGREPMDRLMECLERHEVMRPAVRLRPLGNLKN